MIQTDQDTEITLGAGRLLGLFFGLAMLCAVFFVMGYSVGKRSGPSPVTLTDANDTAASSSPAVKPAASQGAIIIRSDCSNAPGGCPSTADSRTPAPATGTPPADAGNLTPPTSAGTTQNLATPAPEVARTTTQPGYVVQVAAVSKQQDAEALVAALRRKQYPVFISTPATDSLFHVQMGPFADPKEAEAIRSRLVADGYNPIVKR